MIHQATIVLFSFTFTVIFSYLVASVALKTQFDKNHQDYVVDYILYQAALMFLRNLFSFWIEFGRGRQQQGKVILFFLCLYIFILYFLTKFTFRAWNMNDDLTEAQLN